MNEPTTDTSQDTLSAAVTWIRLLPYPAVIVAEAGQILLSNRAFQQLCSELDLPYDHFDLAALVGNEGTTFSHFDSIDELLPGQFAVDQVALGSIDNRWYLHGLRLDSRGGFSFCCLLTPDPLTVVVPKTLALDELAEDGALSKLQDSPTEFLSLDDFQRRYIKLVLDHTDGKVSGKRGAAEILAVNPQTLFSKLKRLGIKR